MPTSERYLVTCIYCMRVAYCVTIYPKADVMIIFIFLTPVSSTLLCSLEKVAVFHLFPSLLLHSNGFSYSLLIYLKMNGRLSCRSGDAGAPGHRLCFRLQLFRRGASLLSALWNRGCDLLEAGYLPHYGHTKIKRSVLSAKIYIVCCFHWVSYWIKHVLIAVRLPVKAAVRVEFSC